MYPTWWYCAGRCPRSAGRARTNASPAGTPSGRRRGRRCCRSRGRPKGNCRTSSGRADRSCDWAAPRRISPLTHRARHRLADCVKIAHVRERHGPAGPPWRLAARSRAGGRVRRWLDLEVARRRRRPADPRLAHNSRAPPPAGHDARRPPGPRPAGRGAAGARRRVRAARTTTTTRSSTPRTSRFGPPILRPPSFRDFYAFERHVRTMWERRGGEVPETWYRLPIFYFSQRLGDPRPGRSDLGAGGSHGARLRARGRARSSTRRPSTCPPSAPRRRSAATRSSTTGRPATCSARRRRSGSGRPRARTSRRSIGPWLVTPDELADARPGRRATTWR